MKAPCYIKRTLEYDDKQHFKNPLWGQSYRYGWVNEAWHYLRWKEKRQYVTRFSLVTLQL